MTRLSRDDVIAGAGRRFATDGYHGTSMRDLGEELGILGSSIYSHVGGKQELLVAVVERGSGFFDEAAATAVAAHASPMDRMEALISGHIGVLLDHRPEAKTYLTEIHFLDDAERSRVSEIRRRYEQVFIDTISEGVTIGDFREDVDASLATIHVLSILNAIDRWYDTDGRLDRRAIENDVVGFVVAALR